MARYEYKPLSENVFARWSTKDGDKPFMVIDATHESSPIEVALTPGEAKNLAAFLVQYLFEYISND